MNNYQAVSVLAYLIVAFFGLLLIGSGFVWAYDKIVDRRLIKECLKRHGVDKNGPV